MIYFDFNFGGLCYLSILNNGLVNFDVKFEGMGFVGFGTRQTPRRWRGVCASITSAPIGAGAALLGLTHDEYVRVQRLERLRDDLSGALEEAKVLGAKDVVCAWIPHEKAFTRDDAMKAAEAFNRIGKGAREAGLTF